MVYNSRQVRGEWWDPKLKNKKTFPHWRLLLEFYKSIRFLQIDKKEKRKCYFILAIWSRRRMGYLIRNLFQLDSTWKK
jgi:hypothetical protein